MTVKHSGGYAAAFGAVAMGWLLFSWPWLSGAVTIPYDAKAHFQPQLQFLANALHSGDSPFWTHNVFAGSPQIADPQSLIFSPAFLLAYFDPAPSFRELDLYCFLLLGSAAISVLMFFKDRGWHPAGAAVAALAAAFGGSAIWRIQHIAQIEAFAFFMLCLWLLARALDRKSLLYGVLSGLAACGMVISPGQIALIGAYVLAGYTLHHWLSAPRFWTSVKETILPLFAGGVVATVLASGPILLSFLFLEGSNRPEIPFKEAARGALHPASLLTAVVPDLYGAHSNLPYWGPASSEWIASWLSMTENMGQIYIGALPILLLLAVGFMKGGVFSREIRFFSIAATFLFLYSLGRYTRFFTYFYYYLPGVDLFRRPSDATYALGGITSIVCGYLLHLYLSGTEPANRHKIAVGSILATLFAVSLGVAAAHGHFYMAAKPVLLTIGIFTAGWLALDFVRLHAPRYGALTVAALAAFMTADLAINNGPNRSTAQKPSHYDEMRPDTKNETVAFLKSHLGQPAKSPRRDRVELVGLGFEWPNVSLIHNFDHTLGYNPLRLGEVVEGMGASENIAEAYQRDFTPLFPSYRSLMADLLGLRYIAIDRPIEKIDAKLKPGDLTLVVNTRSAYIYENPRALPRVLFAFDWQSANFEQMAKDGRWPLSFDPRRTVLLRSKQQNIAAAHFRPVSLREATTTLDTYRNTEVQVTVDAPRPGFLVLNDVWHPWWFGTVDGKPADILRANVLFRAIQVPAGRHVVRFEFKPIEGAVKQIVAKLKSRPVEPTLPPFPDLWIRPEASARESSKAAG
jgi:hypothetical protein